MNDRAARIAMLLGLTPLTVFVWLAGGQLMDVLQIESSLQGATLLATLVLGLAVVWIWRRYIPRTPARLTSTVALSALLLGQVLVWRPLWDMPGCANNDIMRVAQGLTTAGLWCIGCALSWWGVLRLRRKDRTPRVPDSIDRQQGRSPMTPNTFRLAVGLALMPLLPGLFWMSGLALDHFLNLEDDLGIALAFEVCAVVVLAMWVGLWRRVVVWSPASRAWTLGLAAAILLVPWVGYLPDPPRPFDDILAVLPLFVLAAWFIGTAITWRTPGVARVTGANIDANTIDSIVRCPGCHYSLRGLREVRCPECGWTSTVDDIVARGLAALDPD